MQLGVNVKFGTKKYLEDFIKEKYKPEIKRKFAEIETLRFIENKENIILIGTSGSGKTHYATAIGIKACFVNIPVQGSHSSGVD